MTAPKLSPFRSVIFRFVSSFSCLALAGACMTSGDGRQLREDLFTAQKRLLELEQLLSETGKESKTTVDDARQRIASTSTRLDQINADIARINGELDALRVGLKTGEMPGQSSDEDSLAKQAARTNERLDALERRQHEIVEVVEKASAVRPAQGNAAAGDKKAGLKSVGEFTKAFGAKKYKHIISDAPSEIAKKKGNDKDELRYLYAESLYKVGRIREAALAFNEIVEQKSLAKRKVKMQNRLGDCFRHLGDKKAAMIFYREVVRDYPDSDDAQWASEQIAKLH